MQEGMRCHDCEKSIVSGVKFMEYVSHGETYAKCAECYASDPVLRNFRETEVYSRVVGYIRPVKQWNKGKQAEYGDRREFSIATECSCL